jgi:hypothetical protein
VSNAFDTVVSSNAMLTVLGAPIQLLPVAAQTAYALMPFTLTNEVTGAGTSMNSFRFELGPGAPSGARINTNSGVFFWIPSRQQAPSSNFVTVILRDDATPPLSVSNSFSVLVTDYFELGIGTMILQSGQTGSVVLTSFASTGVTNVRFGLEAPEDRLTNLALHVVAPQILATIDRTGRNRSEVTLSALDGAVFLGSNVLANLSFSASTNTLSAFLPLLLSDMSAIRADGGSIPRTIPGHGRVVDIGTAPLLEALLSSNGSRGLILYGNPGVNYVIESAQLDSGPLSWQTQWQTTVTNLFRVMAPSNTSSTIFFRARE